MLTFKEFNSQRLDEKLITFGGKAYPKFNNVVLTMGGSASGKSFIANNLLGIEGWKFDVDRLKELAIKAPMFNERVKQETGTDLSKIDLKNPENVSVIHDILGGIYNIDKKALNTQVYSILTADKEHKPNLIFDVTLKSIDKLGEITRNVIKAGYKKENIHIVWIVNDIEVAYKQNAQRSRTIDTDILLSTHEGAALTMHKILEMGDKVKTYMDGDIIIAFNKAGVELVKSGIGDKFTTDDSFIIGRKSKTKDGILKTGQYLKSADYVYVKRKGKTQTKPVDLQQEVIDKIKQYTPEVGTW
jgi:hypothetical protein